MALFKADDLRNIAPRVTAYGNNAVQEDASTVSQAARDEVLRLVEPLFGDIRSRIWSLEREINDAFEETGFSYFEAWEALPHSAFSDSLLPLYSFIEKVKEAILDGTFNAITPSLRTLAWQAEQRFKEVEEFLEGRLSRMSKEEWLKIHPNFHQEMEVPALDDELAWTIGSFVRPSQWFIDRGDELERQNDISN